MTKFTATDHPLVPSPLSRQLDEDELRLRRRRSKALGLALGALALIFFAVTILKMAAQMTPHAL